MDNFVHSRPCLTMREALAQHSLPLHPKLDGLPALRGLVQPTLTLSGYRCRLDAFAMAYDELEAEIITLETMPDLGYVPVYTPRLPALRRDLAQLRRWMGAPLYASWPEAAAPEMSTQWHYWGMRYVLEGATQGGEIIALRLRKNPTQLSPLAFAFWQILPVLGKEWPTLCRFLNNPSRLKKPRNSCWRALIGHLAHLANAFYWLIVETHDAQCPVW